MINIFLILFSFIDNDPVIVSEKAAEKMKIESPAFAEGSLIPEKYTCDGEDISPPLRWNDLPQGASSLALICDDPDAPAGTWVHWVIFNIPYTAEGLPESVPAETKLADGSIQGTNDFKKIGYGGPCPPGGTHRYFFKLYALDCMIELDAGTTKWKLTQAMKGHVLAEAQWMGKYKR
jgi:Raf kinase inhibitor-like YbhB/YbcL family protein